MNLIEINSWCLLLSPEDVSRQGWNTDLNILSRKKVCSNYEPLGSVTSVFEDCSTDAWFDSSHCKNNVMTQACTEFVV